MSIEIECLRRWLNEITDRVVELEDKVQDLETKTASDLSQSVVAESATSEEEDCLWVARDKRTDTLYVYEVEPVEQYCETFAADDEEEKSFRIDFDLFPEVTFENSPQKLMLESSISKTETVEDSSGSPEIPEDQNCVWLTRDNDGQLFVHSFIPIQGFGVYASNGDSFLIDDDRFSHVTFENSPQRLVLESSISKTETSEKGYVPTVDDFFYTPEKENSEKPNNQEFDKERALELVRDIENCTIDNANSATKAILLSCEELRKLLGNE